MTDRARRLALHVVAVAHRHLAESRSRSPRTQRWAVVVAALLFIGVATIAYLHLPSLETPTRWGLLVVVALLGVPVSILVNAVEFQFSAQLAGRPSGLARAIAVMTVARAANALPVPGTILVRIGALRQQGASYGLAFSATATAAASWVGAMFLTAGSLLLIATRSLPGLGGVVVGIVAVAVTSVLVRYHVGEHGVLWMTAKLVGIDVILVAVSILRLLGVLLALGLPVTLAQAGALAVAEVLASATGIFPGGLGIREIAAGVIGPFVGLPMALGVIASATDRVIDYVILAPASVALWLTVRRGAGRSVGSGDGQVATTTATEGLDSDDRRARSVVGRDLFTGLSRILATEPGRNPEPDAHPKALRIEADSEVDPTEPDTSPG